MLYKYAWLLESGGLLRLAGSHPPVEDGMLDAAAPDAAAPLLLEGSPGPVATSTAYSAPCPLRTLPEDKVGSHAVVSPAAGIALASLRTLPEGKYRSHMDLIVQWI